ncbi:uncharacterized protein C8Q71DRAFT_303904 [Rhodofomes roseus]|uniref:F-box domain-containing protein n=1 Tax=Rhodofomes roseus TaxID=34475 RepID=A0ABQ8K3J7_9APHY|nr:uncharacterized protein C8Q71DRAFT_303904 [Rhodofomes roseus]KAH9831444.1 hypothetical protein C8Q71DRAFT_303904 [Rhodofomes roseus]
MDPALSTLPQELWDSVLDYLCDDQDTLAACCLTCQAWLGIARILRWRTVSCPTSRLQRRLQTVLQPGKTILNLAPLIVHLDIQPGSNDLDWFTALPNVQHLTLRMLDCIQQRWINPPASRSRSILAGRLTSIRMLSLPACRISPVSLAWLLTLTPNLSALDLLKTQIMYDRDLNPDPSDSVSCRLEHLSWNLNDPLPIALSSLCTSLRGISFWGTVPTWAARCGMIGGIDEVSSVLRNAGTSLTTLALVLEHTPRFYSTIAMRELESRLDLSHNPHLTSLHIDIVVGSPMTRNWTDIPSSVLACIPQTLLRVRRVDIHLHLWPHEHLLQRPRQQEHLGHEITHLLQANTDLVVTFHVRAGERDAQIARRSIAKRLRVSCPWLAEETERLRFIHDLVVGRPPVWHWQSGWEKSDTVGSIPLFQVLA